MSPVGHMTASWILLLVSAQLLVARELPFPDLSGDALVDYVNSKQSLFKAKHYGWTRDTMATRGMPKTADPPTKADPAPVHDHISLDQLPTSFDSRQQWPQCSSIQQIYDQSSCGCCYAFCTTEIMADRMCIHAGRQVQVSVLDVISCCPDCGGGCGGGSSMNTLQHWVTDGFVTGGENQNYAGCQPYPFPPCAVHGDTACPCSGHKTPSCNQTCQTGYSTAYKQDKTFGKTAYLISGDVINTDTVVAIQKEIMTNGPVKATFDMYDDFYAYQSGVYTHTVGTSTSRHCVKIIGWGTDNGTPYWLISNSFGSNWGENGFVKFLRNVNECGIEAAVGAALPAV